MMQAMMRMGLFLLSALAMLLPGCQRDDTKLAAKLDQIIKQNEDILEEVKKGGGPGGRGDRPKRPRPSPSEVYAVPLDGAAWTGNENAKVTIVEAFEFA
jgi:hypothetical protein